MATSANPTREINQEQAPALGFVDNDMSIWLRSDDMAVGLSPVTTGQEVAQDEMPFLFCADALSPWATDVDTPGGTALGEAARQSLRRCFVKLLACREAVLAGEDARNIH